MPSGPSLFRNNTLRAKSACKKENNIAFKFIVMCGIFGVFGFSYVVRLIPRDNTERLYETIQEKQDNEEQQHHQPSRSSDDDYSSFTTVISNTMPTIFPNTTKSITPSSQEDITTASTSSQTYDDTKSFLYQQQPHPRISTLNGRYNDIKTITAITSREIEYTVPPPINHHKLDGLWGSGIPKGKCLPMKEWQSTFQPLCNSMHELDMQTHVHTGILMNDDNTSTATATTMTMKRLGVGGWRDAWKVTNPSSNPNSVTQHQETIILKTLWGKKERGYDDQSFHMHRVDAVTMERLTSSSRVIDVYGFCGESVLNEAADMTLEDLVERGRPPDASSSITNSNKDGGGVPVLTTVQKIEYARDIAAAVADVHDVDYADGGNTTVVHRDLKADNIVIVDGRIKVNDFNSAVLLMWDSSKHDKCHFSKHWQVPWYGQTDSPFTEKIDIFCLGGLLYYLITDGKSPYQDESTTLKDTVQLVNNGILPVLPSDISNLLDQPEILEYIKVMNKCFAKEPRDRPTAREIAEELNRLLENLDKSRGRRYIRRM